MAVSLSIFTFAILSLLLICLSQSERLDYNINKYEDGYIQWEDLMAIDEEKVKIFMSVANFNQYF